MRERKEYNDRWNAPLVNPGVTFEEYEEKRKKVRQCNDCGVILGTQDSEIITCYSCYAENFRKGYTHN